MKDGLLTFDEAASKTPFASGTLHNAAMRSTPAPVRLKVERFGHRTVRIKESALRDWLERRQRFA
jgi:hypothetical protein